MTEIKKPKRVTPANIMKQQSKQKIANNSFTLPEGKLDLEFFLKRNGVKYSADQIIGEVFGEDGFKMTEQEKVYSLLKAMESLEITMPFEFICQSCQKPNPIAVEVTKVMTTEGTPKQTFTIEVQDYIFQFERPHHIQDTQQVPGLAGVGMYMLQWLVGHNQGQDFEFVHLPIPVIIKLAEAFAEQMFKVSFHVDSKCSFCKEDIKEDFLISVQDLSEVINEL